MSRESGLPSDEWFAHQVLPRFSQALSELPLPRIQENAPRPATELLTSVLRSSWKRLPSSMSAAYHYGLSCLRQGDRRQAETVLESALRNAGTSVSSSVRAEIMASVGLAKSSNLILHSAQELDRDAAWILNNAAIYGPDGRPNVEALEQIVEQRPAYADAWNNLGVAWIREERWMCAAACFQRALLIGHCAPALVNYVSMLTMLLLVQSVHDSEHCQLLALESAKESAMTAESVLDVMCDLWTAREDASSDLWERPVWLPYAWSTLAVMHSIRCEHVLARAASFQMTCAVPPDQRGAFGLLSTLITTRADIASATGTPRLVDRLGLCASHIRQLAEKANKHDVLSVVSHAAIAFCLWQRYEHATDQVSTRIMDEAVRHLVTALEQESRHASIWNLLSLLLVSLGEYNDAINIALQAWDRDHSDPTALNNLGAILGLVSRIREGHEILTKALNTRASATHPLIRAGVLTNLGTNYRQKKQFDESLRSYKQALELVGESSPIYNNIGVLFVSMRALDEAREMFQRALELDPNYECARSNLFRIEKLSRWQTILTTTPTQ